VVHAPPALSAPEREGCCSRRYALRSNLPAATNASARAVSHERWTRTRALEAVKRARMIQPGASTTLAGLEEIGGSE